MNMNLEIKQYYFIFLFTLVSVAICSELSQCNIFINFR